MNEFAGYLKDVNTGAVIGVQRKSTLVEIENSNRTQIKLHRMHLIQWEILTIAEGEKAKGINQKQKPGRKPQN